METETRKKVSKYKKNSKKSRGNKNKISSTMRHKTRTEIIRVGTWNAMQTYEKGAPINLLNTMKKIEVGEQEIEEKLEPLKAPKKYKELPEEVTKTNRKVQREEEKRNEQERKKREKKVRKTETKGKQERGRGDKKNAKDIEAKKREKEEENEERMKVLFWNIAELRKKEDEFWEYIKTFDVVRLIETWVKEGEYREKVREQLAKEFNWEYQSAKKKTKKGRAKGKLLTGVKKKWQESQKARTNKKGLIEREIIRGKKKWRIFTVYSKGMEKIKEYLEESISENGEDYIIIEGISTQGQGTEEEE